MDVELRDSMAKPSARFLLQAGLRWLGIIHHLPLRFLDCQEVTGVKHDLLLQRLQTHLKLLLILVCVSKNEMLTFFYIEFKHKHSLYQKQSVSPVPSDRPPHLKSTHSRPAVISPSHSLASQLLASMTGTMMTSLVSA